MKVVDTKGQLCPAPLIATRKALKEAVPDESFIVLTDNQTSLNNVKRFLSDNNTAFRVKEEKGVWSLTITKSAGEIVHPEVDDYCENDTNQLEKGNYIIAISSDKMGEGDDHLGHLLMANFIKAIKSLDSLPDKIVFYNKGVILAAKESPVIEDLKDLEKMGIKLLLCSTCINYYALESGVGTGILSNMYVIAEAMASAGNIIRP
jgi:selenium metabolism protein YedF